MKQTAIEWLYNEWSRNGTIFIEDLNKARSMERKQIIEAHGDKQKTKSNPDSIVTYGYTYTGEMYYNETYLK
jgi:hypothetical protein